jgi:hypothetical protein
MRRIPARTLQRRRPARSRPDPVLRLNPRCSAPQRRRNGPPPKLTAARQAPSQRPSSVRRLHLTPASALPPQGRRRLSPPGPRSRRKLRSVRRKSRRLRRARRKNIEMSQSNDRAGPPRAGPDGRRRALLRGARSCGLIKIAQTRPRDFPAADKNEPPQTQRAAANAASLGCSERLGRDGFGFSPQCGAASLGHRPDITSTLLQTRRRRRLAPWNRSWGASAHNFMWILQSCRLTTSGCRRGAVKTTGSARGGYRLYGLISTGLNERSSRFSHYDGRRASSPKAQARRVRILDTSIDISNTRRPGAATSPPLQLERRLP